MFGLKRKFTYNIVNDDKINHDYQAKRLKSQVGYYRPLDENVQHRNKEIHNQSTDAAGRYNSKENVKRVRNSNDNENYDPTKQQFNVPRLQYGIKKEESKFKETKDERNQPNHEHQINSLRSVIGCYRSLDQNIQYRNKQILNQSNDTASRYNSTENVKRLRNSNDIESNDPSKQQLSVPRVKYGIKKSSQLSMRKILEEMFESEITADGWEKNDSSYTYHTKIRGKLFNKSGDSVIEAKERVAEIALKDLANFKYERIAWPKEILSFRLNQDFADDIERMVKTLFDEIMVDDFLKYKSHKVRSGLVMTNGKDAKVVALATGTKCLSNINLDNNGTKLRDMHAEVLACRSFRRYIYHQLEALMDKKDSIFWSDSDGKEIQLREGLKFHLYISTVPCGDARVFSHKGCNDLKKESKEGSLRTKRIGGTDPLDRCSRIKSMSCSDKIARFNILGLQGGFLAQFIPPIYLDSIVIGSTYDPIHLHRAVIGRLESIQTGDLPPGYMLNKPKFDCTSLIETENFAAPEDFGVFWSPDNGNVPEIINLNTGLTVKGNKSSISKFSFLNMFKNIDRKIPIRSRKGIEKYSTVKKTFYAALEKGHFGAWKMNLV